MTVAKLKTSAGWIDLSGGATIPAGGVGTTELAAGAVTSAKILDGTIVDADVNASAFIVTSKLSWYWSATPPAGPALMDSWLYPLASGYGFWHFVWDGSYWNFVGGSDGFHEVAVSQALGSAGAWVNLATDGPLFQVPRAGDYDVHAWALAQTADTSANVMYVGLANGNVAPPYQAYNHPQYFTNTLTGSSVLAISARFLGVAAGDVLKMRYYSNNIGTAKNYMGRKLWVRPIRVT